MPDWTSTCIRCGKPAELVHKKYYRWMCRGCGQSWVEEGSPMDIANMLIDAADADAAEDDASQDSPNA